MSVVAPGDIRAATRLPRRGLLRALRPPATALLRRRYDLRVSGEHHVPTDGPVILASNHVGVIDGPLLVAVAPRLVHALAKSEIYRGAVGRLLLGAGQIPIDRSHADIAALRTCVGTLRAGRVVAIFPEGRRDDGTFARFHHGAAWLGLVSGAPVVPVTLVGTREPGGHVRDRPRPGSRIDIVFSAPWQVSYAAPPRRRHHVLAASADLRAHLQSAQTEALTAIGRSLPGPLPVGEAEADPDTGFDQSRDKAGPA